MQRLTDYTSYKDAHKFFTKDALWDLFHGNRDNLNIAYECIDRHQSTRAAINIANSNGNDQTITFGDLSTWSNRVANWLLTKGFQPGNRVAIMLEPSLEFYATLFGVMKAGFVAVPLFTAFGSDGLSSRLEDCKPVLLILDPEKPELSSSNNVETVIADPNFLKSLLRFETTFTTSTTSADMAMYQYTSGTSRALPEAVKHHHRAIVTVMIAALYATGVRPGDKYMCPSSPAWGHGLWHGTLAPLALGIEISTYAGKFDPEKLLAVIEKFEITNLSAAATHYRMMRNINNPKKYSLRLKKLSFTGEPLDTETAHWAKQTFGHDICSIYGSTEVGVIIANYPGSDDLPVKIGALGKPLPGCNVSILDQHGKNCQVGEIGEIMLWRGDSFFPVKDLGSIDEDGYYFHHGRADDVIISAGWTMSAVEIEDILLKHPDITEAAVIGVPDVQRGKIVKAFIVSKRPESIAFNKEVQSFVRDRLSRHEYPRLIKSVNELPKTPAGKVNRRALREQEN
ncbi:MAG: acetate--CoA ligase [Rhodospirillaceae bacterium]|nr:acetate--CoA ligase [Rhodospirillaceae bacterium]